MSQTVAVPSMAAAAAPITTPPAVKGPAPWDDAVLAAVLMTIEPRGTGGVALRALPGPVREMWLSILYDLQPPGTPRRRVPLHVTDGRLLGGLDLAATLRSGRPVAEQGLLVEADGGILELAMAERIAPGTVARINLAFDTGEVILERDGLARRTPSRFAMIALDEGIGDEGLSSALLDRLAFHVDLNTIPYDAAVSCDYDLEDIQAARALLGSVTINDAQIQTLCGVALALGIPSLRASILACHAARAHAALNGRTLVTDEDLAAAGRLVLAPRATQLPPMEPPPDAEPPPPEPQEPDQEQDQAKDSSQEPRALEEMILEATKAAIPAGLLAQLQAGKVRRTRSRSTGKAGAMRNAPSRGRPAGVLRGEPRAGQRLNIIETLRAAAPWQRIRREERLRAGKPVNRLEIRPDDFRISRFKHKSESTTIFVVDASGSSALHRLAEAKGAVELLLADCYVRRDQVALVAFGGQGAEVLLPPTRSLVRAKRCLAGLPGGGGTPLAAGIDLGMLIADGIQRRGGTPILILMTDGRANVARDGTGGRTRAFEEALASARLVRALEITALVIDISPRPQPQGRELAKEMGALYLPLPHADARALNDAVRATTR